jgi:hypothetical protein
MDVVPGCVTLNTIHADSFSIRVFSRKPANRGGVSLVYQDNNLRRNHSIALATSAHLEEHIAEPALLREYETFLKSIGGGKIIGRGHIQFLETKLEPDHEELAGFVKRFATTNRDPVS